MTSKYDLIVVGTGWHGLSAAKVYIEIHPSEEILVLESQDSIGGTWAKDRIYAGLKSNNLFDAYESPDFPMSEDVYGVKQHSHIPGAVLHQYLTDYAKKFGIFSRTQFKTNVDSVEAIKDGYRLSTTGPSGTKVIETKKLIIATGLTSTPNFPQYRGKDDFQGQYFHAKDFCRKNDTLKTAENVVVVGGAKSAYDVAYAYATTGAHVDMVIRPNGKGPVYISKPWVLGGKARLEKLLSVRALTWFSPCPFGGIDGYSWPRWFLHGTAIGRFIVDKFWASLGGEVIETNAYAKHDELKLLQPRDSAFWIASGLSILNYDSDWYELCKQGKITVHGADIDHLSKQSVHLTDGTTLKADIVVTATGWKKEPTIKFVNFGSAGIGLPLSAEEQAKLVTKTDEEVFTTFPRLRQQPNLPFENKGDPFRMYRFIVPPARINDHNIAFAGMVSSVLTANQANAQAIWISAFLDGKLDHLPSSPDEVTREVLLHTQWNKWRYPYGYGATLPDLAFDAQPYLDLLLNDCGLTVNRKAGLYADLTQPYEPKDYRGLVDEWLDKHPRKA